MKYKVFFLRYVQSTPDLFGNVVPVDGTDVLKSVIINDFRKRKELSFINPRNGKIYYRHYAIMPQGGLAVIDVGKYEDGNFVYASVAINLSRNQYQPYIVIGCHHSGFSDINLIADMVTQSLNWALNDSNIAVKLVACNKSIAWEKDIVHTYLNGMESRMFNPMNAFGFELIEEHFEALGKNPNKHRKSANFDDYLPRAKRQEIKAWLHNETDQYMYPVDMMRAIRVLYELNIIKKPTYEAFVREFDKEHLIAVSTYNSYMNLNNNPYENDTAYEEIKAYVKEKF